MGALHSGLKCFEGEGESFDLDNAHIMQDHPPPSRDVNMNMDLPLSCYFINSGHNSYLTGNQLASDSGTETIEYSLNKGCRVIELDVYNKQSGFDGPVCKHGGTLTAPVLFSDCVAAVGKHAFTASPYPVIITLENHTDEENQVLMANILRETLGDKLYIPEPEEIGKTWKSPKQLQYKVLIRANSGKASPALKQLVYIHNVKFESLEVANKSESTSSSSFDEIKAKKLVNRAFSASGLTLKSDSVRMSTKYDRSKSGSSAGIAKSRSKRKGMSRVAQLLGKEKQAKKEIKEDVAEAVGQAIESPADEVPEDVVNTVHSLGEVYTYTSRNLMRVYPGGLRVDSSNYNPIKGWTAGASFVALNWQKCDKPLWINRAMFAQNGGCGYVMKPTWMLQAMLPEFERMKEANEVSDTDSTPATLSNPVPANPLPTRVPRTLIVKIYSAHAHQGKNMSFFRDDMYVQMAIVGMPMDKQKQHTHTAHNSGRLIVNKEYRFDVMFPEMAMLMISLKDEDLQPGRKMDDVLGHWEIALNQIQPGDYKITLLDREQNHAQRRWVRLGLSWAPEPEGELQEETDPVAALGIQAPSGPVETLVGPGIVNGSRILAKVDSKTPMLFTPNPLGDGLAVDK